MTRKYDTVEIDGIQYELHGVKADKKPIGFVPVRCFSDGDPFTKFMQGITQGELELIIDDYKYGLAVRLQQMARKATEAGGYTKVDRDRIFNEMSLADADWLPGFAGHWDMLENAIKAEYDKQQAENPTTNDKSHIWEELL